VRVVEAIKGSTNVATLDLDFDEDREDTVLYSPREKCLVFLNKRTSGHFATFGLGKYAVTNAAVLNWKPDVDYKPLDEVRKEIHKYAK
jgi:hypothetical protein